MSRLALASLFSVICLCPLACSADAGKSASSLTDTSAVLTSPVFRAPHDAQMGQVVITIPEVTVSAPRGDTIGDLGQTVRSQLTATLASSPNFLVADRESLPEIADEHRLGDSGAVSPLERPTPGRLAGARYIVKVTVTELDERVIGKSSQGGFEFGKLLGIFDAVIDNNSLHDATAVTQAVNPKLGIGSETVEGLVGMEIRVVDVNRGVVVATTRAQAKLTRENSAVVLGITGLATSTKGFSQTVIAHATRAAVEQATVNIHESVRGLVTDSRTTAGTPLAQIGK